MHTSTVTVIGYVRVSRVAGRSGASFISPGEQRAEIERLAARRGLTLSIWLEELDQSGGNAKRPKWLEARDLIRRGEAQGVIVLNFSRWSRDTEHALASIREIRNAGGDIWSCQEDFDTRTPAGWMMLTNFFAFAQMYREQAGEGFKTTRSNAVARGVYISPTVPFGYIKNAEKKLEPDPKTAPIVVELFERKAGGVSVSALANLSKENGGPGRSGLNDFFKNVAYLGVARSGEYVNESAHQPLVSRELFDRAQAARGVRPIHTGALSKVAMLTGLLRCGNCGSSMNINQDQAEYLADGSRARVGRYCCNHRSVATKDCDATATIRQPALDAYVNEWVADYFAADGPGAEATESMADLDAARKRLEDAEQAYERVRADATLREDDYDGWRATLNECKARVEMTREDMATLKNKTTSVTDFEGDMLTAWPSLSIEVRRTLLHSFVKEVRISPAHGRRGIALDKRVTIIGVDGTVLNHRESTLANAPETLCTPRSGPRLGT